MRKNPRQLPLFNEEKPERRPKLPPLGMFSSQYDVLLHSLRASPAEHDIAMGNVLYKNGQYEEALSNYNTAIQHDPDCYKGHLERGNTYFMLGDYEEAMKDFTRAISIDPNKATPYCNRSTARAKEGNWEGALQDINEAIRLKPKHAEYHYTRGFANHALGALEAALKDLDTSIRLKPNCAKAYSSRGVVKMELGSYEDALCDIHKALELDPDSFAAHNNLAAVKKKLGDYEDMMDHAKITQVGPYGKESHDLKGVSMHASKRYLESVKCLDKAIRLNPRSIEGYCNRGVTKEALALEAQRRANPNGALRLSEEALADYEKSLELIREQDTLADRDAFSAESEVNATRGILRLKEAIRELREQGEDIY